MTDVDQSADAANTKHHHTLAAEVRRNRRFVWAMTGLLVLVVAVIALFALYCGRSPSPVQNQKRSAADQTSSSLTVINGSSTQTPTTQMSLQPANAPEPGSAVANDIDAPPAVLNPTAPAASSTIDSVPAVQLQAATQLTDAIVSTPKKVLDVTCQLLGTTCNR
ncbi:MAG TPA: hypothetical protein VLI54_05830 [Bacillota bacterium]|nr:hypothetical protein [Bacillota bacterium]